MTITKQWWGKRYFLYLRELRSFFLLWYVSPKNVLRGPLKALGLCRVLYPKIKVRTKSNNEVEIHSFHLRYIIWNERENRSIVRFYTKILPIIASRDCFLQSLMVGKTHLQPIFTQAKSPLKLMFVCPSVCVRLALFLATTNFGWSYICNLENIF